MTQHQPLRFFIPRKFLIAAACAATVGFGIPNQVQAEIIHYSTTFSASHLSSSRAQVSPSYIAPNDQYEIRFSLDTSVLASSPGIFSGLVTAFSLTAPATNVGSFPTGSFTLDASSSASFYNGGSLALRFNFSASPQIVFSWDSLPLNGSVNYLQLYFIGAAAIAPSTGTAFDSVAGHLLTATPNLGNSGIEFRSSEDPNARAFYTGSFTQPKIEQIPEPGTAALLATAAAAMLIRRRQKSA